MERKIYLMIYGLFDAGDSLFENVSRTIHDLLEVELAYHDGNDLYRIGKKMQGANMPLLLELTNFTKKSEILCSVQRFKGTSPTN